jgi:hypothetical protein
VLQYTVVIKFEGLVMSVSTVRPQAEVEQQLEQERWKQTLEAMESAAQGKVVDASEVHSWLNSWGTENEQDAFIAVDAFNHPWF